VAVEVGNKFAGTACAGFARKIVIVYAQVGTQGAQLVVVFCFCIRDLVFRQRGNDPIAWEHRTPFHDRCRGHAIHPNERGKALGLNMIAFLSGQFIGLILGGILAYFNWRYVFLELNKINNR
jgi:hypothetical protein